MEPRDEVRMSVARCAALNLREIMPHQLVPFSLRLIAMRCADPKHETVYRELEAAAECGGDVLATLLSESTSKGSVMRRLAPLDLLVTQSQRGAIIVRHYLEQDRPSAQAMLPLLISVLGARITEELAGTATGWNCGDSRWLPEERLAVLHFAAIVVDALSRYSSIRERRWFNTPLPLLGMRRPRHVLGQDSAAGIEPVWDAFLSSLRHENA